MKLRHIGYACINLGINETTNHTFRLANLSEEQAAITIAKNIDSLKKILAWNVSQGIKLFRVGSSMIPFASHTSFTLDWQRIFRAELNEIRTFVQDNGLRLSMHPGQYTVLNSFNSKVVSDSVRELEWQAELISILDPQQGLLVLHLGGAYGNKEESVRRFEENFYKYASPLVQQRLTLENDDTTYSVDDVLPVCQRLNIPMIFDLFHHKCLHTAPNWQDGLEEKLEQIVATWKGKVPKMHLSSQKPNTRTSHADYIEQNDFDEMQDWMEKIRPEGEYDLMIEAKLKEKAVQALQFRAVHNG
ncbi:UV DNA damage repair endonuclease UvsE [Rhodocytophaga rosea]|uniref:UV DNA damage repair endonuclease UvsE n=1 Tax=Rhodocytophaga rosea TaxID=2704465 RepID=A0A6C0GJX9_9BACT|nr:UV DNA damage repair endonuclease UvsE [Rhodocytophaga rosea]QHT68295.1 UV DNA damage repair endonuclease UvsE [Rhodocytophaga rosea]